MRKINLNKLPVEFIQLVNEKEPLFEDIGIFDEKGNLSGVIITPNAYSYFLEKVEEDEDKADLATLKEFDSEKELSTAPTLDDFLNSKD